MSCSLKHLSSDASGNPEDSIFGKLLSECEGSDNELEEDKKTQLPSEDDYVPPSDTTDGAGNVPPSDKSTTSTTDGAGAGAATSTLSDSNDLGKFCFCRSTVVIISP